MGIHYRAPLAGAAFFGALSAIVFILAAIFARGTGSVVETLAHAGVPALHLIGWLAVALCAVCVLAVAAQLAVEFRRSRL